MVLRNSTLPKTCSVLVYIKGIRGGEGGGGGWLLRVSEGSITTLFLMCAARLGAFVSIRGAHCSPAIRVKDFYVFHKTDGWFICVYAYMYVCVCVCEYLCGRYLLFFFRKGLNV